MCAKAFAPSRVAACALCAREPLLPAESNYVPLRFACRREPCRREPSLPAVTRSSETGAMYVREILCPRARRVYTAPSRAFPSSRAAPSQTSAYNPMRYRDGVRVAQTLAHTPIARKQNHTEQQMNPKFPRPKLNTTITATWTRHGAESPNAERNTPNKRCEAGNRNQSNFGHTNNLPNFPAHLPPAAISHPPH